MTARLNTPARTTSPTRARWSRERWIYLGIGALCCIVGIVLIASGLGN